MRPALSDSSARRAAPVPPPNLPRVNVAALPRNSCDLDAARDQDVGPHAGATDSADIEHAARRYLDGAPLLDRDAVHADIGDRAGDTHPRGGREPQCGPAQRALQPGRAFGVAEHSVAEAERQVVHRARWWNADVPVSDSTRPVLDGGLHPGPHDIDLPLRRGRRNRADDRCGRGIRSRSEGGGRGVVDAGVGEAHRVTTMRTGVGSKPLQGLLIWGQLETRTRVSISARRVSFLPGRRVRRRCRGCRRIRQGRS